MWLFALIVGLPLIEIALFVTVGAWLGLWATLGIVLGTAALGISLLRQQGTTVRTDLRSALTGAGTAPQLIGNAMTIVAAILLILPGFLTDALGLLLMLPPIQRLVAAAIARRARGQAGAYGMTRVWRVTTPDPMPRSRTMQDPIDGTWEELPSDDTPPRSGWTRH